MHISLEPINIFYQATGANHIASGRNWIDLQPITAMERGTHQRQPTWLFMKMPQRRSHRALLCAIIVLEPLHIIKTVVFGPTQERSA